MPGPATRPATDAVFTMWPPSALRSRWGRKAWTPWMTPHRLTSTTHFQSFSVRSLMRPPPPTPALLHTRWTAPNRSMVAAARAATLSASATSVRTPTTPSSSAVAASGASSMSAMTTCMPSSTHRAAKPRPIPDAPPVTTATLPCSCSTRRNVAARSLRQLVGVQRTDDGQGDIGHRARRVRRLVGHEGQLRLRLRSGEDDRAEAEDRPVVADELVDVEHPEAVADVDRHTVEAAELEAQGLGLRS